MKRETLKAMGLTDDQINLIMEENGKDINSLKNDIETLKKEKESLSSEIKTRDTQLEELKKTSASSSDLTAKIAELEEANAKAKEEHEASVAMMLKEHAIESALRDAGAINLKAARALIDDSSLKLKDGALDGIKEQLKALKGDETSSMLFKSDAPPRIDGVNPANGLSESEASSMQAVIDKAFNI
ncbi:phage scaffolding protein [Guggenheimella bovis]